MEGSLLTAEILSWIGFEYTFGPEVILERDVAKYVAAVGGEPEYRSASGEYAVPELFYRTLGREIVPLNARRSDGLALGRRPMIGEGQVLAGGIEVEWRRRLAVGDAVVGVRTLRSLTEKFGKTRQFVVAKWDLSLTEHLGKELLLRETTTELMY